MTVRGGLVRVPARVSTAAGIVLTAGLAVAAVGGAVTPRWLAPSGSGAPIELERAAEAAEARWRSAAVAVAAARGVAADEALVGSEVGPLKDADAEMLNDMVLTAVNLALDKSRELQQTMMGPLASGLPF